MRFVHLHIVLLCLIILPWCQAQQAGTFYNKGSVLTIKENTLYLPGHYINATRQNEAITLHGKIHSEGTIELKGDFINQAAGRVFQSKQAGKVLFNGTGIQSIFADSLRFGTLELDNPVALIIETPLVEIENEVLLRNGLIRLNGGLLDLIDTSKITGEQDNREISGSGYIRALERNFDAGFNHIAGSGLLVEGNTGAISVRRYHVTPAAGEEAYPRLFYYHGVNTAALRFGFKYLNDAFEEGYRIYFSTDSIRWTKAQNPSGNNIEMIHSATVPGFKEGWIALANNDCANPPASTITPANPSFCRGDSVTFGISPTSDRLIWSNGATTPNITVGQAGTYQLIHIADNGCMDSVAVEVVERALPQAAFSSDKVSACQLETIAFSNESQAEDAITQQVWTFGDGDVSLLSDPGHQYQIYGPQAAQLVVRTAFGCSDTARSTIFIHPNPVAGFSVFNHCENATMQAVSNATIEPQVGTISYAINSYSWLKNGELLSTEDTLLLNLTDTLSFELTLRVASNTACVDSSSRIIHIAQAPVAGFQLDPFCENERVQISNNSRNTTAYQWFLDDSLLSTNSEPQIQVDTFGLMSLTLYASNQAACSDSLTKSITVYERPHAVFDVRDTCAGLTIQLIDSSVFTDVVNYFWNFGDATFSEGRQVIKSYEQAGIYNIKLTLQSEQGCQDSALQIVDVFPVPFVDLIIDTVCTGELSSLNSLSTISTGTLSHLWIIENRDSLQGTLAGFRFAAAGDHQVQLIVTSEKGCSGDTSVLVTSLHSPQLDLGDVITSCHDSLLLDFSHLDYRFLWTTGDTTKQLLIRQDGSYGLQLTSDENCVGGDTTIVMLGLEEPAGLGNDTLVCDSVMLDVMQFNSTYLWSTGDTTAGITVYSSGTYSVKRTTFDGCINDDTVFIEVHATPVFDLEPLYEACLGDTLWLDTQLEGVFHLWSIDPAQNNAMIALTNSDTIEVEATGAGGCTAFDTTVARFYNKPLVDLGADTASCDNYLLQLNTNADSWQWSDASSDSTLFVTTSGSYLLMATNGGICSSYDTVMITIVNSPVSFLDAIETRCIGFTRRLNPGLADHYLWSTGDTSQVLSVEQDDTLSVLMTNGGLCTTYDTVIVQFLAIPTPTLDSTALLCGADSLLLEASTYGFQTIWYQNDRAIELGEQLTITDSGTYSMEWNDGFDCRIFDTIKVARVAGVAAGFTATSIAEIGDTIQFVQVASPHPNAFLWHFGDGISDTAEHPLHQYFVAGSYEVLLEVQLGACADEISHSLTIYNEGESPIDLQVDSVSLVQLLRVDFYPSPFETDLNTEIDLSEKAELHLFLYNSMGEQVWNKSYETQQLQESLNFDWLEPGAYHMYVINNQNLITIKLIKL